MKLAKDIVIGESRAGVLWVAYAGRHTLQDVKVMCERLTRFGGCPRPDAVLLASFAD